MNKTVVIRKNTVCVGGGVCSWLLDALRACVGTFADRRSWCCDVAITVLCMCRSSQSLVY